MTKRLTNKRRSESDESWVLVKHAFEMARALDIQTLLVQADGLRDVGNIERLRGDERIIWICSETGKEQTRVSVVRPDVAVTIPETASARLSQIKLALFVALLEDHLEVTESILCLSGVVGSSRLDTLLVVNPKRDFPWFEKTNTPRRGIVKATSVVGRVIEIAIRFSREGREGQSIGTCFVIANAEELEGHISQLILNPCAGHPKKARNIQNSSFLETLREFTALDGAIVVNSNGVVESAATYLDAPRRKARVKPGLGARHTAAAAITAVTDAIAVVVSQSSGHVVVFGDGKAILELENSS